MKHGILMYSGGVGSWAAGMRAVERYGKENITLLFCDTMMEDEDLYRFLYEGAAVIDVPVTRIADGRTPWQIFHDERFLGNSKVDPCSKLLKRHLADRWVREHFTPSACIRLVGMDACQRERNRLTKLQEGCAPYLVDAPLLWDPPLDKDAAKALVWKHGLKLPRLYELGFEHNNCGGACVKAGQQSWALLLRAMPERYAYHMEQEESLREYLGKDVSILTDRSGDGKKKVLTLRMFMDRLTQSPELPLTEEWEACNCSP